MCNSVFIKNFKETNILTDGPFDLRGNQSLCIGDMEYNVSKLNSNVVKQKAFINEISEGLLQSRLDAQV